MAQATMNARPAKPTGQEARRRYQVFKDEHGRKWGAVIDFKADYPDACGKFEPQKWRAPFMPDDKYLRIDWSENRLLIDYPRMLEDAQKSQDQWEADLDRYALGYYTDPEERGKAVKNPPRELLNLVGPRPHPHPDAVKACMAGHPWMLGLTKKDKPEWADAILPKPALRKAVQDGLKDDAFFQKVRAEAQQVTQKKAG